MQELKHFLKISYFLTFSSSFFIVQASTLAQIIPDGTLGAESSVVQPDVINELPADRIDGGAIRGSHLFHSFQEFNIPEGRGAYFYNPAGILNIFSRITGKNPSQIFGTLGVLGNANLFLLNPNGIVFGSNARLDLRGSFLASTASGLIFDSFEFSTIDPQAPPLLTVNIPTGLRFRDNPGTILNQSRTSQLVQGIPTPVGLAVSPGETLALVGGNLSLNSGNLTAAFGNILLGSVASPGFVGFRFNPTGLELDYTGIANFGNIELLGTATVNASGLGGGAIQVRGGKVVLSDRANLVSDTLANINGRGITIQAAQFQLLNQAFVGATTLGTGAGGDISIRTTDAVELQGSGFENFLQLYINPVVNGTPPNFLNRESVISTLTINTGKAGNIIIDTRQLMLREGAAILSPTFGAGDGGNITIRASEWVDVSGSGILAPAIRQGNAGTLTIDTGTLTIRDETTVSTSTFGAGNGGNLTVRATDAVILREQQEISPFGTSLSTSTIGGTGDAGNLEIQTRSLLVDGGATITSSSGVTATDRLILSEGQGGNLTINASDSVTVKGTSVGIRPSRSQIATATIGNADSGDLTINTGRLIIQNGGGVGASTVSAGKGGNININASDFVEISGKTRDGVSFSGIATASGDRLIQALFPTINPTGAAGELNITTRRLTVRDEGTINVESSGVGRAGTITVIADAIALDNQGTIDSTTGSGAGGNITLQAQEIRLRQGSRISSDAGTSAGGNITLNSDILVAFPEENNNITANARTAQGGRVTVNVANIFGFAAITREQLRDSLNLSDAEFATLQVNPTTLLPSNDIAAISQTAGPSLQGTVTFSTSGINPAQGLVALPQNVVDSATLIAANPCLKGSESEFVLTGRGGLPATPGEALTGDEVRVSWGELPQPTASLTSELNHAYTTGSTPDKKRQSSLSAALIPAQGWTIDNNGKVTLVANRTASGFSGRSASLTSTCLPR